MRKLVNYFVNFILVCLSVVICLYGFEFFLASQEWFNEIGTGSKIEQAAKAAGATWDERSTLDVISDLEREGKTAYTVLAPQILVAEDGIQLQNGKKIFPVTAGLANATNVFCKEMGYWIVYESDQYGFNNPKSAWENPEAVFIGDSFTHGACVPQGDDFAGNFRKQGVSSVNLGIGGTGSLIQLGVLKEYGSLVKPKVVFWMYYSEDLRDNYYEKDSPTLMAYMNDSSFSQELAGSQEIVTQGIKHYLEVEYDKRLERLTKQRSDREKIIYDRLWQNGLRLGKVRERISNLGVHPHVEEGREPEKLALTVGSLKAAKKLVESWGGQMVFVWLPSWVNYGMSHDTYGIEIGENYLLKQDIIKTVRELELPIIDVQEGLLDKMEDPVGMFNHRTYGHFTLDGYKKVSDYVYEQALAEGVISR